MLVGMGFYARWAFIDDPSHFKSTCCQIVQCNITMRQCYHGVHNYSCYKFFIIFAADIDNRDYTQSYESGYDLSGNYPKICSKNMTECYYDDRNIYDTLTIFVISSLADIGWGTVMFVVVIAIVGLISVMFTFKLRSDYVPIRDDTEIGMMTMMPIPTKKISVL